jgi:hypothetical protein
VLRAPLVRHGQPAGAEHERRQAVRLLHAVLAKRGERGREHLLHEVEGRLFVAEMAQAVERLSIGSLSQKRRRL